MQNLEKSINLLFSRFDFFWIKLNALRLHDGTYVNGEPFDYLVIREEMTTCFDAKECKASALYASKIPAHQFNDLLKAERNGAFVFFLIYFTNKNIIKFIHPKTILDDGKATPDSKEVESEITHIIKRSKK